MKEILTEIVDKIKRFLTHRDLLIFIFFLIISTALWSLQALRKDYETTIQMPISYINLPNDYVITNELPDHLNLSLEGKGSELVRYRYGKVLEPLEIDMDEVVKGRKDVSSYAYMGKIQKQIKSGTLIRHISPDSIHYVLEKQKKKILPISLDAKIDLQQQYTFSDSIKLSPSHITVYGPQKELNDLDSLITEHLELENVQDTLDIQVNLKELKNIRFSDSTITVSIFTEKFTERTIQVPITPQNVPANCILRIFPSSMSLNYQVALSDYEKVDASAFSITVDFNEAKKNGKDKLKIKIHRKPKKAFNIKLKSESVDYIIEEKNTLIQQ